MTAKRPGAVIHLFVLAIASIVNGSARASADNPGSTKTLSPYFFVEGGDAFIDRLPLESTVASIVVSGVIAEVTVRQQYVNRGIHPIHARYVFPASTRAAVHGMRFTLGDQVIEAKIRERQQARQEFEKAKEQGKTASLLEQQRPNVFSMDVANIMPGDRVFVELRYTELLVPTDGVYELVYPTVVGPRYSNQIASEAPQVDQWIAACYTPEGRKPTYAFDLAARIESGIPIGEVQVPSHLTQVRWMNPNRADIALDPSDASGGDRDFILRYRLAGEKIQSGLSLYQNDKEGFFLLTVEPPRRVLVESIPPREYVFIVDVSGSMRGFPLHTAKALLANLVGNLRPVDRFNVLLFSGSHWLMAPESLHATPGNIGKAIRIIDREQGGGGTELLPALKEAMSLPSRSGFSRNFVVVTDGYIDQEKGMFNYVRDHLNDANVFAFGIGESVNRFLIEGLAKAGMGGPFIVTGPGEAAEATARFQRYIETPALTDIRVRYEGFDAYDVEPSAIPDLLAERPLVIHGKWKGKPGGKIVVTGVTGQGAFRQEIDVSRDPPSDGERALSLLWARSRIGRLSDFNFGDETPDVKNQIVDLGLTYNLLTRHTSFIAVHEVVRNFGSAEQVNQPLPLPQGVSDAAVGMEAGSEPELAWMAMAGLAMFGLWYAHSRRQRALA